VPSRGSSPAFSSPVLSDNIVAENSLGERIAALARGYVGVPYHHCGRDRNGLDCAGLIIRIAHDLELTDWNEVDYSRQVDPVYLRSCVERFCSPVAGEALPGDLLLIAKWGEATHVSVYVGDGLIVHASNKHGRVVEHSYDKTWRRVTIGVFRWRATAWLP
jgi:cell wall-associated NlpC family hydrolase